MIYNKKISELNDQLYHNIGRTERVIKAKQFLDENYGSAIHLSAIASAVHSSKFHLHREFKRHYGVTPSCYLKDKRILEAKKLLSKNSSVTDTCFIVGYDSLSTFSLLFRRCTGFSPGELKRARSNK
ncbi:MAG: AraC family transcriptional regulator [Ginsengibacter sp.]